MCLCGSRIQLRYNLRASKLAHLNIPADQQLTLRYGFNNWQAAVSTKMTRLPGDEVRQAGRHFVGWG